MSNEQINQLVESTLNPYLVFKVEIHHTEEELLELSKQFSEKFINKLNNIIEINITPTSQYMFIKQNFLNEFKQNTQHIKYTITDITNEMWEMNNLDVFNGGDPAPEATKLMFPDELTNEEIIKQIFEAKYTMDDLLDKITRTGIESLNKIQKQMLNEK